MVNPISETIIASAPVNIFTAVQLILIGFLALDEG